MRMWRQCHSNNHFFFFIYHDKISAWFLSFCECCEQLRFYPAEYVRVVPCIYLSPIIAFYLFIFFLLWITVNCATLCVHQKRLLFVYRTDSLVVSASDCVLCNCRFKVRHGKWWIFIWRRKWKICRKMYKNSFLGTVLKFHLASYRFILHARGGMFEMLIAYQHACCPWTLATMTRPSLTEGMPAPI